MIKIKPNKKYLALLLLIILNLSLKIFILFNSNQLMGPALDECYIVNFARDVLLDKNRLSMIYYFDPDYILPGILTGTLVTISFMIFGISGYALKIIPILTSTAIVALVYLFLNKFFNKKTAILTSLLFIFAPFAYTIRTFISLEDYKGSILLTFLIMYIFFNIFYNNNKNYWNFILLGLISGFALSFHIINFVIISTFMLVWFTFDNKFFIKKNFLIFLISFLVVLSPLMIYNYTHDFASFDIIKLYLKTDNSLSIQKSNLDIPNNLIMLITKDIPSSFNFNNIGFISSVFLNYTYYLIFIASFAFIFYRNRISLLNFIKRLFFLGDKKKISKEVFIIIYLILFILVYLSIGMIPFSKFYYVHLLPLYPFVLMIMALFVTGIHQKRKWKICSIVLMILVLFLGLKCNLDLLSFKTEEKIDYIGLCDTSKIPFNKFKIGDHLKDISLAKKECQKLDMQDWMLCYQDIGYYIIRSYLIEKNINKSINNCKLLDEYYGLCVEWLAQYAGGDKKAPKICDIFPSDYKKICYFNFGKSLALNEGSGNYGQECKVVEEKYFDNCKKGYLTQKSLD